LSAQKQKKNGNIKKTTKKIYIPNKQNPPPMDPSPIITLKNKTYVVFSATLDDLCSLAATAKKILCVIITVCTTQSLVLLLLTAAYLSRKIIRKNDRKIVLQ